MNEQTFESRSHETLEEHRQIHFYLDQIARALEALSGPVSVDTEPMRRLAAQFEGLKERLLEHHRAEERGLFGTVLEVMPDCRVEVNRLINEHERMIEILELARIHAQRGEPAEAVALCEDMRGFLEMFRRHEQAEEDLLERAVVRERSVLE